LPDFERQVNARRLPDIEIDVCPAGGFEP